MASSDRVKHRTIEFDGVRVFYREAGDPNAPAILLLHGFPSSSYMFRDLLPALADHYHLVAPDYPGFGSLPLPDGHAFRHDFQSYAELVDGFTRALKLERFALYIQDYGAPIGLRLALRGPERITALIVQNGNAYEEGLSAAWGPLQAYWREPTLAHRSALRSWLSLEGLQLHYTSGLSAAQRELLSPESWLLDWAVMGRPGNIERQLDLFRDYQTNVALYPKFQAFFREQRPPTLIVWGRHDPFFTVAGAEAFRRDLPDAELHLLDAGHFALETHLGEIAQRMLPFLDRTLWAR